MDNESEPCSGLPEALRSRLEQMFNLNPQPNAVELVGPLTQEQIKEQDELEKMEQQINMLERERDIRRGAFWLSVDKQIGYGNYTIKDNVLYRVIKKKKTNLPKED